NRLARGTLTEGVGAIDARRLCRFAQNVAEQSRWENNSVFIHIAAHEIEHVTAFAQQFTVKRVERILSRRHASGERREAHLENSPQRRKGIFFSASSASLRWSYFFVSSS